MATLKVVYERGQDGWWIASIPKVSGCHTQGRTIEEARRRIRWALAVCEDEGWNEKKALAADLADDVRLPADIRSALERHREAREQAERTTEKAQGATLEALGRLLKDLGLSERDAAPLLGLSHQRVHQLAGSVRVSRRPAYRRKGKS